MLVRLRSGSDELVSSLLREDGVGVREFRSGLKGPEVNRGELEIADGSVLRVVGEVIGR